MQQPVKGTPLVTVVIPVYNRVHLLPETVRSVLEQTHRNLELIVVDDGSSENVAAALAAFADPRIAVVRQNNQGNAAARNAGISRARGEFIICLDSDDVWQPEMLARSLATFDTHPAPDVIYTQARSMDGDGKPYGAPWPAPLGGDLLEALLRAHPVLPSAALVRRSCFARWGPFTAGLDDWELWLRWAAAGCYFACVPQPLLHYRVHAAGANRNYEGRRAVHFAMLDTFYSLPDLPPRALALRKSAYARQFLHFTVLAQESGRATDAAREFLSAMRLDPAQALNVDFLTQLACAHQGREAAGGAAGFSLAAAESALYNAARAVAEAEPIHPAKRLFALSDYVLGRLAYSRAHDMGATRRFMRRALSRAPLLLLRSDLLLWLARARLGYAQIQRLKAGARHLASRRTANGG